MNKKIEYFEIEEIIKKYPDKLFYCVIGARGCGKSYSTKRKIIKDFLRDGSQAMVFRRYKNQVDDMCDNYFNDIIINEFNNYEFELKGNIMFIDGEEFCYFVGLNGNNVVKGVSLPKVKNVIYEEFMPEPSEKILNNEYKKIESILYTLDRAEDRITVICIGNNTSYYNPLFDTLKQYPPSKAGRVSVSELMVIYNLETPPNFKEKVTKSKIGKLSILSGTSAYNIDNKNISNDTFNVVNKKELWDINKLIPLFTIRIDYDKIIKVWLCNSNSTQYYYIDNNSKGNYKEYYLDREFQNSNNTHISLLDFITMRKINFYLKIGGVFYNSAETKYYFENTVKYFKK